MARDDLCTTAEVKTAWRVPATDTSDDARIAQGIVDVTAAIKAYVRREWLYNPSDGSDSLTVFQDGGGYDHIQLVEFPIITLTSVHDDTDRVYGAGTLLVEGTDFVQYPETGEIQALATLASSILLGSHGGTFQNGQRNIQVIYVPGFRAIPAQLRAVAIIETIARMNKDQGRGLLRSTKGPLTDDYNLVAFSADSKRILNTWRSLVA